ncbi:TIGD4 [Branchiostoma lanceolatum]|uniref:TIGD4 protein n=1 Tax=Branchiostoma lanceolatum TaxID=7740 RepID=A0A8J9Z6G3_BRALA|nr:TIGD4 [Branchiostoma lanceolatum]
MDERCDPAPSSQKSFGWSTQIHNGNNPGGNGNNPGGNGNNPGGNGNPVHYVQPMNVQAIAHVNPPAHNPPQQLPANPATPLQADQPAHSNDELCPEREGMKAVRKLPADFEESRDSFHEQIKEAVAQHHILDDTVVNFNQTGVPIVPVGEWTLEEAGARQVPIVVLEDKRQITVPLTISLARQLLPPQVLYQGKTEKCYPKLGLAKDQPGLAVFDGYKAHRTEPVLAKLREAKVIPMLVPASCTGEPLDSDGGLNDALKKDLTKSFMTYYAGSIAKEIAEDCLDNDKVNLRLSKMKPLHAHWLLSAMDRLSPERELIMRGWERTGIKAAVENVQIKQKAWMTAAIFKEWVRKIDGEMGRRQKKIVLLLDNCTAHPHDVPLDNIRLVFLPPNTTSLIQDTIRIFKAMYRSQMMRRLISAIDNDNIDSAQKFSKTTNLLETLFTMREPWRSVKVEKVRNYFAKAGLTRAPE